MPSTLRTVTARIQAVYAARPLKGGTMARQLISSGSSFERDGGYSRAVVDGDWIFVSGTTGYDYVTMTIKDDLASQARQCFANIADVLAKAGSSLDDVVRVHYYVTEAGIWDVL